MFPEHRELISQLKTTDRYFSNLFDKHNELDQKIKNAAPRSPSPTPSEIDVVKKENLLLKDQVYAVLKKAAAA